MASSSENELIERLIEMVRARKYLYDPTDPSYKDAQLNRNAWNAIAKALGLNTGEAAKKKWRNKRDHYIKIKGMNKTKSGQAAEKSIRYKWSKQLSFLNRYMEDAPTTSNVSDKEDEIEDDLSETGSIGGELDMFDGDTDSSIPRSALTQPTICTDNQFPEEIMEENTTVSGRSQTQKRPRKAVKKCNDPTEDVDAVVCHAIKDLVKQKKAKEEDSDELFLKSCLNQLKELPPRIKSETKIEIMQLLFNKQYKSVQQPLHSHINHIAQEQQGLNKGPFMTMLSGDVSDEYFKYCYIT